ncbi:MAG: ABC transporter permease [Candidatus Brocadiae bacterium]|nr:ABC transporter permease [Candidatus Brocadiia bacterium]
MRAIDRKMLRDTLRLWSQLGAIALVVACGIGSFVCMRSVRASLGESRDAWFERSRFADLFAGVASAPDAVGRRLADVPGVAVVETRVVKDVTLSVRGMEETASGRLVSIPETGRPALNDLALRDGRWPDPARRGEVLVSESFARAHGLKPGESLDAVLGGTRHRLEIAGIALSPEYTYEIAPGALFPDHRRFGVLWMSRSALASAFDMDGAFNDVCLTLIPGTSPETTAERVDLILAPWGGRAAYGRDRQTSARYLDEELKQLDSIGGTVPVLFLGVAAFLVNVVLTRLIATQREEIAVLKAIGYANSAIAVRYLGLACLVVLGGAGLGILIGRLLGTGMMGIYGEFFIFPLLDFRVEPAQALEAVGLSVLAGGLGAAVAVWRAVRLPPAEAMRPESPTRYRRGILDRLGIMAALSPPARIVARNVARRPVTTAIAVAGISVSLAILVVGNFSSDALEHVMEVSFERVQSQDLTVTFDRSLEPRAVRELSRIPGVLYAEPIRDTPVRLRAGPRSHETAIQSFPPDSRLRRLLDADLRHVPLPDEGLLLGNALAAKLAVRTGDLLEVEILEGERRRAFVPVSGTIDEMMGMSAYMSPRPLASLLREGERASGGLLLLDPARREQTWREIKGMPRVSGATLRTAAYDIFKGTAGEMQMVTRLILVLFAVIVAVGVVYNGARVMLSERSRELGTLRVMGFTRGEVASILFGELAVQLVLALPLGCLMGYGLAAALIASLDTELYRFPLIIEPRTYAFAMLVVLAAGAASALIVRRKLDGMDLVSVLKVKE